MIVARTPNQAKRVTGFAERLKLNIAVIHGCQDRESESEEADGRNSPPPPPSGLDNLVVPMSKRRSVFTIPSLALGTSNYYSSACFPAQKYIYIYSSMNMYVARVNTHCPQLPFIQCGSRLSSRDQP